MTRAQMTELFTVMSLAWPQAEMFRAGLENLGPTITLWTKCTADVDFRIGQIAVFQLCQSCKFPPTIAEFRQVVEKTVRELEKQAFERWNSFLLWGNEEFCRVMHQDDASLMALKRIGPDGNWYQFLDAYKTARVDACTQEPLPGMDQQALTGQVKKAGRNVKALPPQR